MPHPVHARRLLFYVPPGKYFSGEELEKSFVSLVPYWNNDCREAFKVKNRKRAIYRRLRCESSFEESQGSCPVDHQECQERVLAETLPVLAVSPLSGEPSKNWTATAPVHKYPSNRLRFWESSRKHRKGGNASHILCISHQQRKPLTALCKHQDSASAEPRTFSDGLPLSDLSASAKSMIPWWDAGIIARTWWHPLRHAQKTPSSKTQRDRSSLQPVLVIRSGSPFLEEN